MRRKSYSKSVSKIYMRKIRQIQKISPLFSRGFSLIELIIYASILALILIVMVHTMFGIGSSYVNLKVMRNAENSAAVAMERMTRDIRDAESINLGASTLNAHPGKLLLNVLVGETLQTVEFSLSSTTLRVKENGVDQGPLTATNTAVTNLVFRPLQSLESEAVKIEMSVEGREGNIIKTYKLYSTIILRGSY